MKKYLILLAGLFFVVPYSQAEAKAVKLGRGNAYSVAADSNVNTGSSDTELRKGQCESNEECGVTQKCVGYKCVDVCSQPAGQMGQICQGGKCIADPSTPHAFKCVDACYNVVCKSGYTTEISSNGCCCVASSCPSGQRLENGKCVANCSGVTCKSGYKAVSNATGCCCESSSTCASGYVYHPIVGKCVAAVCPAGCSSGMCKEGYCSQCDSGYYLNYADGMCPKCSSAISNCSTCTSSSSGVSCTKCNSGYYLSGGKCVSCPANATCSGTSSFTCKSGYERYNDTCRISSCDGVNATPRWCPDGFTRIEGKGCCPPGVDPNKMGACMLCHTATPDLAVDCGSCNCGVGYVVVRSGMTCSCQWDGVTFPAKPAKVCF